MSAPGVPGRATGAFDPYVPRSVLHHLAARPFRPVRAVDGTMVLADLSGFTRLSERLQGRGTEGAELLVRLIDGCFSELLGVAYDNGGSLVKFGGDALLLFFSGERHAERGCRAAAGMRERLRSSGRVEVGGVRTQLRMTVGVHSGEFHFFLVGESHLEHLVVGPATSAVVATEAAASHGRIVLSRATAALLPAACAGAATGPGVLLRRPPPGADHAPAEPVVRPDDAEVARVLSTAVRAHVAGGGAVPEHRRACVAFLRFRGTDDLLAREGLDVAAQALHELVAHVQAAADAWEVCFLGSDVDADGGTILLTAGAPRVVGDDEERMLLTLRQILDGQRRLPVCAGVNRGPAFAGVIGTPYRRAYAVMGDTTNLAARVAAKAPPGGLYATPGILARSTTTFACTALEPFAARGKARPVQAFAVGPPVRRAPVAADGPRLPLAGREAEMRALTELLAGARHGRGGLLELVGDAGIGKTRLLEEARAQAAEFSVLAAPSEAHTAGVPYAPWRGPLRELLGIPAEADPAAAGAALRAECGLRCPALLPWLPLLAALFGAEVPPTAQAAALLPQFRRVRVHEAALELLKPALRRPTLVEFEHAQHMDEASAALLGALAGRLGASSWAVLLTRRAGPCPFAAPAGAPASRLDLGPLAPAAARILAEAATDAAPVPPYVVEEAVERSGGNPQFLLDLLAAAGSEGDLPDSAQAAAMAQIDALPPGDRALVRHASVLGSGFAPAQLAAVLGRDAAGVGPGTWARLGAVFAVTAPGEIRFRRAAVREAAYAALPFQERRALHARVAAVLDAAERAGAAADPAVLARHHRLAGDHACALGPTVRAAERASAQAAHADAARLYRHAVDSARALGRPGPEVADLWDALGGALRLAGATAAADEAFRAARRLVPDDPVRQAELYFRQARLAHRAGHRRASVRWARRGRRVLAGSTAPLAGSWNARLIVAEATNRVQQGRLPEAVRLCRRAIAAADGRTDGVAERAVAHASYVLDMALVESGRPAEAVHSARALEIYDRLGELGDKCHVLNNLGAFAYFAGRWDDAVRLYREAAELSERLGDVDGAAYGDVNVGEVLSDQGHWDAAEECLGRALRRWRATDNHGGCALVRMFLGRLYTRTGRYGDALDLLAEAAATARATGDHEVAALAEAYGAEAVACAGRPAEALRAADRLARHPSIRLPPVLARVRAIAGADPSAPAEAVAVARRDGTDYDLALALDLVCRSGAPDAPAARTERDALLVRLGVVRLGRVPRTGGSCR